MRTSRLGSLAGFCSLRRRSSRLGLRLRHSRAELRRRPWPCFPIEVADTSGEAGNPQWPERVAVVTGTLARELTASGRYRAVDLTSERGRLAGMAPIYRCDGCWRELAREVGADAAAITVVHKISTLISSMHVWLVDVATQKLDPAGCGLAARRYRGSMATGAGVPAAPGHPERWWRAPDAVLAVPRRVSRRCRGRPAGGSRRATCAMSARAVSARRSN